MTTPRDPRWTAKTRDLLARALCTQDALDAMYDDPWEGRTEDDRDDWRRIADAGLAALADKGLLLPDGTQTRTEHGYRYRNSPDHDWTRIDIVSEDEAIAMVGDALATIPNAEAEHLTRRVHTEPWQPVPDPDTTPTTA